MQLSLLSLLCRKKHGAGEARKSGHGGVMDDRGPGERESWGQQTGPEIKRDGNFHDLWLLAVDF